MSRAPWDLPALEAARLRQSRLTKPPGALGLLEDIALQMAALQGQERPSARPAAAVVFAADHPVHRHGVSLWPQAVTAAMVQNFLGGGAAASVLCAKLGVALQVVDVGVAGAYDASRAGSVRHWRAAVAEDPVGDLCLEDAMGAETFARAVEAGETAVENCARPLRVIALGEMGIGNTTPASAVIGSLLSLEAEQVVGHGAGADASSLARKRAVVTQALRRCAGTTGGAACIQRLGGREIAALYGAMRHAAARGVMVLVDGFIATAAALALLRDEPGLRPALRFAHRSAEAAHVLALQALDARPCLDLGMRLGEASGALTALPLIDLACALHGEMATFEEAAVPLKGAAS